MSILLHSINPIRPSSISLSRLKLSKLRDRLLVLLLESLGLVLQVLQFLINVGVGREVNVHRDAQTLAGRVLVVQGVRAVGAPGAGQEGAEHVVALARIDISLPLDFIVLRHFDTVGNVLELLLGAVAEQVAEEVCVLLEDEGAHNSVSLGQLDRAFVICDPVHILWHLDFKRILESHLIVWQLVDFAV